MLAIYRLSQKEKEEKGKKERKEKRRKRKRIEKVIYFDFCSLYYFVFFFFLIVTEREKKKKKEEKNKEKKRESPHFHPSHFKELGKDQEKAPGSSHRINSDTLPFSRGELRYLTTPF